jgi:RNA-binding protein
MKNKSENKKLTGKQVRYLKGQGHHLKPLVMLGRDGLSENVLAAANAVLNAHELIKVKVGNGCLLDRREAAESAAEKTGSEIVQILGKTFLLFRANPDRDAEQRIKLPQ